MRKILKAALKTSSGTLFSLLCGVAIFKIIAILVGPSGVGLFSILRQIQQVGVSLGSFGGQTALVQGLASREDSQQASYVRTVFCLMILGAILTGVAMLMFAQSISEFSFAGMHGATQMVRFLVVSVGLGVLASFLNGVFNAERSIGWMATSQATAAGVMLLLAYPATKMYQSGFISAFPSLLIASVLVSVLVLLIRGHRAGYFTALRGRDSGKANLNDARHFLEIGLVTLLTAAIGTGTLLVIRSWIVIRGGLVNAGIFDAAWTLSMLYVTIVLTSFSTYYMPTLAGLRDSVERNLLIGTSMRLTIMVMLGVVSAAIALKPLIITTVYSNLFLQSLELMRWMLIGDYIKATSWVIGMPILSFPRMRVFFWTELFWNAGILFSAWVSLEVFKSLEGIGIGFTLMYLLHFCFFNFFNIKVFKFRLGFDLLGFWLSGLLYIVLVSMITWNHTHTRPILSVGIILGALAIVWSGLRSNERSAILGVYRWNAK